MWESRFGRRSVAIGAAIGAMAMAGPGSAGAATQIGQTFDPSATACSQNNTWLQSVSPGNEYAVPFDGVITSWSHLAAMFPPVGMKLKIGTVTPLTSLTISGESGVENPVANQPNTFLTRVPVKAGDVIGFYFLSPNFADCGATGQVGYTDVFANTDILPGGTGTPITTEAGGKLDVSAQLERDVDKDNFGDETQDLCPEQTATQAACSTAFAVTTKAGKKSVAVTANVPGAGSVSAGDANDTSLRASASKKKKKKKLFKKATVARTETTAGPVTLTVGLSSAGKKLLRQKGKLKGKIKVIYAPKTGVSGSTTVKVKLKS